MEAAAAASDARALKLQLFRRLQARGGSGAWRDYWCAFQRFLAARASAAELHATARALLGDDIQLHNRLVVALLAAPLGGASAQGEGGGGGVELQQQTQQQAQQQQQQTQQQQAEADVKQEPGAAEHAHHHHRQHPHHRHHHQHHVEPKREHQQHNGRHDHEALGRKRSFSSISTATSGSDDHGAAMNKLLHVASSNHHHHHHHHRRHHHHHADDDHQSASLLIGLGRSNAQISPTASDGERSRSSYGDSSSEHDHDSGG